MTNKLEINAATGEAVKREFTQAETDQRTKDLAKYASLNEAQAETLAAKTAARQAALDKLAALGLTADEAAALFG